METQSHKVFISHSSKDAWIAKQMAIHISSNGSDYFLDNDHIDYGDNFDDIIVAEAEKSDELIVLLTPWSKERPYIWIEIGLFMKDNKRIVAVLHGITTKEISTDPRIPQIIKNMNLFNLNDFDEYITQLKNRIQEKVQ